MADGDRLHELNPVALWVAALSLAVIAATSLLSFAQTAEHNRATREHQIATEHHLAEASIWACVQAVIHRASDLVGGREAMGLAVLLPSPEAMRDVLRSARLICDHPDLGVLP